jgi:hypothetical protein
VKVCICTPTIKKPHPTYLESLEASIPLLEQAGIEHSAVFEIGCPYISGARATLLTKALEWGADVIVFIDHDVSWKPRDLLTLIQTPGEVVSGTYRFKLENEAYMGVVETDEDHVPLGRKDGCISAIRVPAGFLKVTRQAVDRFKQAYPDLSIKDGIGVDLFNHGAIKGTWFGEDYAFSKRWVEKCGKIWLVPNLDLTHNGDVDKDGNWNAYRGNFHQFMLRQPGGINEARNDDLPVA